ncbi:MAG: hypothetical protein WCF16_03960 [Alphaproteobacteria bacterium]
MCPAPLPLRVECVPDERGEEIPRRFFFGERAVDVSEVLDSWIGDGHRYFKLRVDEATYVLREDELGRTWELVMFERGPR